MKLVADPGVFDFVLLLESVDNDLANVAEWSDVVGKDSYLYAHG